MWKARDFMCKNCENIFMRLCLFENHIIGIYVPNEETIKKPNEKAKLKKGRQIPVRYTSGVKSLWPHTQWKGRLGAQHRDCAWCVRAMKMPTTILYTQGNLHGLRAVRGGLLFLDALSWRVDKCYSVWLVLLDACAELRWSVSGSTGGGIHGRGHKSPSRRDLVLFVRFL